MRARRSPSVPRCDAWRRSGAGVCGARLRARVDPSRSSGTELLGSLGLGGSSSLGLGGLLVLAACSGRDHDVEDEQVFVLGQGRTLRQGEVLGVELTALFGTLDIEHDVLGDVSGLDLETKRVDLEHGDRSRVGVTLNVHGNLDGDLLAGLDDDEVEVLDD